MPNNYSIGPMHAIYGDFQDNSGAFVDVSYLGKTRGDVIVRPNPSIARGKVDQLGPVAITDAIWIGAYSPEIVLPLVDEDKTKLSKIMLGTTVVTSGSKTALTFPTGPQQIANANIGSLMLIPVRKTYTNFGSGEDPFNDPDNWFFPAVIPREVGEFMYGEVADTDDALNPHTATLIGCYRSKWQDDTLATGLPQVLFRGSPDAAGLSTGFDFVTNALTRFNALIAT